MTDKNRILELALKGLEAERAKLDEEIAQIRSQLNYRSSSSLAVVAAGPRTRRRMSAEARRRISEGMKRRYAAMRTGQQAPETKRTQGGLTAAGRKKLSDMMKARWAAKRRAAKK